MLSYNGSASRQLRMLRILIQYLSFHCILLRTSFLLNDLRDDIVSRYERHLSVIFW